MRLQSEYGSRPVVQPVWSARRPVVQGLHLLDNNFVKGGKKPSRQNHRRRGTMVLL